MEKYHRSDIVGIERENERDENYISKSNPQIHSEKTPYNFHFITMRDEQGAFRAERGASQDTVYPAGEKSFAVY